MFWTVTGILYLNFTHGTPNYPFHVGRKLKKRDKLEFGLFDKNHIFIFFHHVCLSFSLCIYLCLSLSIHPSLCLSIPLSFYLLFFFCLSVPLLSIFQSFTLSVYLSVHTSIFLHISLSLCLLIHPSFCISSLPLPVHPSFCRSLCLFISVCQFIWLTVLLAHLFIFLSIHPSACQFLCPSVCLSFHRSNHQSVDKSIRLYLNTGPGKITAPLSAFCNVLSATFCFLLFAFYPNVTLAWELG
jgi:hypothetical protein